MDQNKNNLFTGASLHILFVGYKFFLSFFMALYLPFLEGDTLIFPIDQ